MNRRQIKQDLRRRYGSFMSITQVAECFGIHRNTARYKLQELDHFNVGKHLYYTDDVVDLFAKGGK